MTGCDRVSPADLGLWQFLGGQFGLSGLSSQDYDRDEPRGDRQTEFWSLATGNASGRGAVRAYVDHSGWSVFAIGENAIPERFAKMLEMGESWNGAEWNEEIGEHRAAELFWATFPGMAVVAVHSSARLCVLLRDPLGYFPLYYTIRNGILTVSTSLLWLRLQADAKVVDRGKIAELLLFGQHYGCRTVWSDVRTVVPGSVLVYSNQFRRGHSVSFARSEALVDQSLRDTIRTTPVSLLVSQVRRLTLASLNRAMTGSQFVIQGGGGVDSSVIIALASQAGAKFDVWTINHSELPVSESQWTEPLLSKLEVRSRVANVSRDRFIRQFVDMSWRSCQPLVGPNFVGGAILRRLAVADACSDLTFINGGMCDTIFGGLSSFHQLAMWRRAANYLASLPSPLRQWISRGVLGESRLFATRLLAMSQEALAAIAYGSIERVDLLVELEELRSSGAMTVQEMADKLTWMDFRRGAHALHHGYFERGEWYGGRWAFPFLDEELFRFAFNLPHHVKYRYGWTKWLWRKLAAELVGSEIAFRRKRGFDAPIRRWFQGFENEMCTGFVADLLGGISLRTMNELKRESSVYWTLLNVEVWGRLHIWNEDADVLAERMLEE